MGFIRSAASQVIEYEDHVLTAIMAAILLALLQWRWRRSKRSEASDAVDLHSDEENDFNAQPPVASTQEEDEWIPFNFTEYPPDEMQRRAASFYHLMDQRRSVRHFSDKQIPDDVVDHIIKTAGTSPSGAHTQPWHFVVLRSAEYKKKMRDIVEEEERINYLKRMGRDWVEDLEKFRTNWNKPYLETAPALLVVLRSPYSEGADGTRRVHYYNELSTGIACGLLIAAIHNAGLVTVTSTPLNAGSKIKKLLDRQDHERVVLLLPLGYPEDGCQVPKLERKPLNEIMTVF